MLSPASKAGLDMTRDPRYYAEGSEHCSDDLEASDYWKSALRSILREVNTYKSDPHILMWLASCLTLKHTEMFNIYIGLYLPKEIYYYYFFIFIIIYYYC